MNVKNIIGILCLLNSISMSAYSQCYIASDMQGSSARQGYDFDFGSDGYSGREFKINIDGKNSSVSGSGLDCIPVGNHTLLCLNETQTVIEIWSAHPSEEVVVHAQIRNGHGLLDGGQMFIGKLKASASCG